LLAKLYLKEIENCSTEEQLRSALNDPPKTLDDAYISTWNRLERQSSEDRQLAYKALLWVSHAPQALTEAELQHALVVKKKVYEVKLKNQLDISMIVTVCVGFIENYDPSVRTLHPTATQFLLKKFAEPTWCEGLLGMAQTCINYLDAPKFSKGPCKSDAELELRLEQNAFLRYAACNWGHHLRWYEEHTKPGADADDDDERPKAGLANKTSEEDFDEVAMNMLKDKGFKRLQSLVQIVYIPEYHKADYWDQFPKDFTRLHIASHFGTTGLAVKLLAEMKVDGLDIDAKDSYQKTPLHVAARKGHKKLTELLLQHDADIEATTGNGETPLLGASAFNERSDTSVVQTLIKHHANVMARNGPGGTGLHWACLNGNTSVVEELLKNGAEPADIASAQATVDYGKEKVGAKVMFTLLMDKRSLAGVKNLLGGTPLHWAAFNGQLGVVELLLEKISEPRQEEDEGDEDNEEEEKDEEELKRDYINAPNFLLGTSLHGAAWNGNEELVEELIEQGADIDAKTALGSTALREACLNGHEAVVKVLLKHGADLSELQKELLDKDAPCMPAKDDPSLPQWLVDRGKIIEAKNSGDGKRTLECLVRKLAANEKDGDYMAMMLNYAYIFRDDDSSWSALKTVSSNGFEALTNLLSSIKQTAH